VNNEICGVSTGQGNNCANFKHLYQVFDLTPRCRRPDMPAHFGEFHSALWFVLVKDKCSDPLLSGFRKWVINWSPWHRKCNLEISNLTFIIIKVDNMHMRFAFHCVYNNLQLRPRNAFEWKKCRACSGGISNLCPIKRFKYMAGQGIRSEIPSEVRQTGANGRYSVLTFHRPVEVLKTGTRVD
jgi:hypothetical protein